MPRTMPRAALSSQFVNPDATLIRTVNRSTVFRGSAEMYALVIEGPQQLQEVILVA